MWHQCCCCRYGCLHYCFYSYRQRVFLMLYYYCLSMDIFPLFYLNRTENQLLYWISSGREKKHLFVRQSLLNHIYIHVGVVFRSPRITNYWTFMDQCRGFYTTAKIRKQHWNARGANELVTRSVTLANYSEMIAIERNICQIWWICAFAIVSLILGNEADAI